MRWVAVLVLLAGACRTKSDGASCVVVAGQFFRIAQKQMDATKLDPATQRALADQLPAMRDALAQACSDGAWSASVRDCMTRADQHAAFEACEQQLTDEQRHALDRAAGAETVVHRPD